MTKTLRASVCFPQALHTSIKIAVATAKPRVSLTAYVSRAVEASIGLSDRTIVASRAMLAIAYDEPRMIRSTITFPSKVAYLATNRARALGLSPSEFIAAVVAHRLSKNGSVK